MVLPVLDYSCCKQARCHDMYVILSKRDPDLQNISKINSYLYFSKNVCTNSNILQLDRKYCINHHLHIFNWHMYLLLYTSCKIRVK